MTNEEDNLDDYILGFLCTVYRGIIRYKQQPNTTPYLDDTLWVYPKHPTSIDVLTPRKAVDVALPLIICRLFAFVQGSRPTNARERIKTMTSTGSDKGVSIDAKVLYSASGCCSFIGVALLIAGVVVYTMKADDGEHVCPCPEGVEECCEVNYSLCHDGCWCMDETESGYYCDSFEHTGSHGGEGITLAIAGSIICLISSILLITMRWCKEWSEKNLHVRYPAVTPGLDT